MSEPAPSGRPTDGPFDAVAAGVGVLLGVDAARLMRLEADGTLSAVATWSADGGPGASGGLPVRASAGGRVLVEGRVWGTLLVSCTSAARLPAGTGSRLAAVTPLVGTAVANAQARSRLRALAEEQAALRRIAELVARGVAHEELFAAVADEASRLVEDEATTLLRFDEDGCATVLATCRGPAPVGARFPVGPDDASTPAKVLRTGRPARVDTYPDGSPGYARSFGVGSSVGAPIVVEDRVWGMIGATTPGRRLRAEAERRLEQFAELAAAALASAQARAQVQQLADEQAALRRVAELVARGVPPEEVLRAVVVEASDLLGDAGMSLLRFRPDGDAVVVATHRERAPVGLVVPARGSPWARERLRATGATRVRGFEGTPAEHLAREYAVAAVVVVPIMVEGQVWGMLSTSTSGGRFPAGTEERLGQFASLAGTAVANADSRAQLTASRARVVAAADATRRQLQRDVHDGAQQRLVQTIVALKLARGALDGDRGPAAHLVQEALLHAERATAELRDLVRGILPAPLTRGGLRAGVESLCADLPLAIDLQVSTPRLPAATETTAYFVIAEALANVVKHANATSARVAARVEAGRLRIEIRDDGAGGADPSRGSGLTGLLDRVQAREGTVVIESPPGKGTVVRATLPVAGG